MILSVLIDLGLLIGPCLAMVWGSERGGDQCEALMRQTMVSDRSTAEDDTPSRLHATWISQGCETRSGPEFVIRKYAFYENGTFLLLLHHYAEESCSVATHTVTARGILWLLSPSLLTSGATEARFQLDTVHVVPLNRQVAHKLGHRVNSSCGPQPKWRPYVPQLVYEEAADRRSNPLWEGPRYNSLHGHAPSSRRRRGLDCLETLGIEFGELRLLRVQKRPSGIKRLARPRVELGLGSLPPSVQTRFSHRPIGLQPTTLLRSDTITGCPMCNTILRGTETSPPVLHEVAALPALIGGSWLSRSCESYEGGLWVRRQLEIWPGDRLWSGRWDHFADPKCTSFIYAVTGAGSYVQRPLRARRHRVDSFRKRREVVAWMTPELAKNIWDLLAPKEKSEEVKAEEMLPTMDEIREAISQETPRAKRGLEDDSYRHLLNAQPSMARTFATMLRGNQRLEITTTASPEPATPTGTTELDLHVAESVLVPGDPGVGTRCGGGGSRRLTVWPRDCVPRALEAPATLGLRARVGVTWTGEYTLLLGPREGSLWEAPLHMCGPTEPRNPELRARLRASLGLRYGLFSGAGKRGFRGGILVVILLNFVIGMR